jgi:hypothetical protein
VNLPYRAVSTSAANRCVNMAGPTCGAAGTCVAPRDPGGYQPAETAVPLHRLALAERPIPAIEALCALPMAAMRSVVDRQRPASNGRSPTSCSEPTFAGQRLRKGQTALTVDSSIIRSLHR